MRILILAAASAAALAGPAAAQPYPEDRLPPRGEVEEIGDRLGRVADAVMDVDVAPVVDAVDPERRRYRRHRHETLGDIAGRRDPYARERIQASIGAATYGIEAALRQIAILTPVLRRSIDDAQRRIDDAMRHRDYRRERDRDYDRDWDHSPEAEGDYERAPEVEFDRDDYLAPEPDDRP